MSSRDTRVTVSETGEGPYTQAVTASNHSFVADEPVEVGGLDRGPAPYDFLLAALGGCTSMTLRMYANQKKWDLKKISVTLTHRKEEENGRRVDLITRDISLEGNLDEAQRARLLEIANKCPVHRTLTETPPKVVSGLAG